MSTVHVPEQAALALPEFRGTPEQEAKFAEFHAKHPLVWALFQRFSFEVLARGKRRYSADAVLHRIRWETDAGAKDSPRVNNNYSSYYARLWRQTFPQHRGLFAVRKQRTRPVN